MAKIDTQTNELQISSISTLIDENDRRKRNEVSGKSLFQRSIDYWKTIHLLDFEQKSNPFSALYALSIIIIVVVMSLRISLLPQLDAIKYPSSWPERIIQRLFSTVLYILYYNFDYLLVVDNHEASSKMQLLTLYITCVVSMALTYLIANIIWIYAIILRPPIPFLDLISMWITMGTYFLVFWKQRPVLRRQDKTYKSQFIWYVLTHIVGLFIGQAYNVSGGFFYKVPLQFQPLLAFVLPVLRYGSGRLLHKVVTKTKGENEVSAGLNVVCKISCNHALCLALVIGSSATDLTAYLICAIDFALHLKSCIAIVKMSKKLGSNKHPNLRLNVQQLVMKETLEILLPLTYCIVFCISYFGPNAEVLGNVRNGYWQFTIVEKVSSPITKIGLFLSIDLLRVALSSLILWKSCKINLFSEYCQLMQIYWKPITWFISFILLAVSIDH